MRCAVTGGSGFIGSHVVDALIDAGHQVVILDHRVRPHRDDVEFKDVDIVNFAAVLNATKGCDYIFHLAAISDVNQAFEQPAYCVELNVQGTVNMLEAARHNGIGRVVLASTVWVYAGARESKVHEETPFHMPGAGHIYSSSKISAELLCHDYCQLYAQQFTILRYGIPYGPRMRDALVIPIFLRKAFAGENLTVAGTGDQYRNFVYVEDLARAHVLCMGEVGKNQIFNLEGAEKVTIAQIAETIKRQVGGKTEVVFTPARPGDYAGKEVSREKAARVLGWEATTPFEEGMQHTIAWYRKAKGLA